MTALSRISAISTAVFDRYEVYYYEVDYMEGLQIYER